MTSMLTERAYFETLADAICDKTSDSGDAGRVSLALNAEASDFLRFNRAALRQATHVLQAQATLAVVRGARRVQSSVMLCGDEARDVRRLLEERALLTHDLALIPDDPWLLLPEAAAHSHREESGSLPSPVEVIAAVHQIATGLDFVGFYAGGPVVRAFADSLGSRHWHRVESFDFSWCLYHSADKAVKTAYAGTHWSTPLFERSVREAALRLELLRRPARSIAPGPYRTLFSAEAMNELLRMLSWGGFGLKARRTGVSSLMKLAHGDASLDSRIDLTEATARGIAPAFTCDGFVRPDEVALVRAGKAAQTLNSPRAAREYGLAANGADEAEWPESLHLAPGTLATDELLKTLDRGLYISNLWYLNYSDRNACHMTGMTRFACFWVEGGELVAPLNAMRFDDSFLRMFGSGLVGLADRAELVPLNDTYQMRQLGSTTTPAAVVEDWRLTL